MKEKNVRGPRASVFLGRLFLGAILGAVVGLAVGVLLPRTYTCTASLLFPGAGRGGGGGGGGGTSGPASPPRSTEDQPDLSLMQGVLSVPQPGTSPGTAALILESRQVGEDLIRRFGLDAEWRLPIERALEEFHRVFVLREGGAGDLRILYTDHSPERARDMVEAAIETLKETVEEMRLDPAQRNLEFLQENVRKAEAYINKLQDEVVRLQRASGGVTP
ncbi:MAG: hypothetical protein QHJ73_06615, partial [Armatimonadota bacterium]|nr:hypothetical protein [Armatimonadota bacterium]